MSESLNQVCSKTMIHSGKKQDLLFVVERNIFIWQYCVGRVKKEWEIDGGWKKSTKLKTCTCNEFLFLPFDMFTFILGLSQLKIN